MEFTLFTICVLIVFGVAFSEKANSKHKYETKVSFIPIQTVPFTNGKHETTTKSCPEGYWLEGGRCVSKTEVPFISLCQSGTLDERGECLKFSPVRFTCPAKASLVGDQCSFKMSAPKLLSCPSAASLEGNHCVLTFEEPPICLDGTAAQDGRCIRVSPVEKVCPEGYYRLGSVCGRTLHETPMVECPSGFFLEEDRCVIKSVLEPLCPPGTVDEGKHCATFAAKERLCPKGYSMSGTACIKTITEQKEVHCANGQNPTEKCKLEVPVPLSQTCPESWKLINGVCESVRRVPSSLSCPDDYHFNGKTCEKVVEYDCSVTTHEVECETPAKPSKLGHVRSLYEMSPKKDYAKGKYTHEKVSHPAPILPVCHKVPKISPKTCQKKVSADGVPFCKVGTYRGGNTCDVIETVPAKYKCDGRSDGEGNCFVEETSEPIRICPAGFSGGHGESCSRTESTESFLECPRGTEGERCATFHPKKCPGGSCERAILEKATVICPDGFLREDNSDTHKKASCSKTVFANLVSECPVGTKKHGVACVSLHEETRKIEKRTLPVIQQCPRGYADEGINCLKEELLPAIPVCPEHSIFDGGRCVASAAKSVQCPKGSVAEKGKCWVFESAEPLIVDTVVGGGNKPHYKTAFNKVGHY